MKNIILLFLFLIPVFLFAQYPATGNKQRLGYQTTGDGLIWRGVAADTAIKPRTTANAYFQLDTVNRVLRRYIATQGSWQVVGGGSASIDSLIYATRYWVGSNYFPLEGGTLTGTGGAGFIGLPSQVTAPGTPASGLNIYAQGSSFNWKGTDGFERQITSSLTGGRNYALPDISGTFALGTGTADLSARWTGTNTLGAGSWSDNLTRLQAQVPVQFQSVTTAGLPTGVTGYWLFNTDIGPGWYDGARWNYVPKADRSAFTSTYVPFTNSSGQLTQASATGQNLRYYNAGSNLHILEISSAIEAKGITGVNNGNADLVASSATNVGRWSFSVTESTGAFSFYDAISNQTPVTLAKNSGSARLTTNSTTTALSAASLLTGTVGSTVQTIGNATDAIGGTGTWRVLNGSNIFSITPTGTSPYFAFTNGTQQGYFQATVLDGIRLGTISNHPLIFVTNSTVKAYLTAAGRFSIAKAAPDYIFDVTSTDAFGIPRGTVAQRPTIASSTTPFRYNTDSTALEYGESVGTWRQLATRAYARSLIAAVPTSNIYTANGSLTADRTLHGAGYTLRLNANTIVRDSLKIANLADHTNPDSIVTTKGGWIGKRKWIMPSDSMSLGTNSGFVYDKGVMGFENSGPSRYATLYTDTTGGYELGGYSNGGNVFSIVFGQARGIDSYWRSTIFYNSTTLGILRMDFTNGLVYQTSLTDFQFRIDTSGTQRNYRYGAGNKEAADLSKTESPYLAWIATDGTIIEKASKTEQYYEITSTSSPQTFSNDYSDNFVNQGGTQASFTFLFPASPEDGQILSITWGNAISTLTLDGNGNTITGSAVTTAVAGTRRQFKYYASAATWIKIY